MDESIRARMDDTRRKLFERFDEDVHQRLRIKLADAKAQLERVGQRCWRDLREAEGLPLVGHDGEGGLEPPKQAVVLKHGDGNLSLWHKTMGAASQ